MFDFLVPPDNGRAVVILDDRGGRVSDYIAAARRYSNEGREVRIIGLCWSACAVALSVRNVCVGPMATVMFHDAFELRSRKVRRDVTTQMLDLLPSPIKAQVSGQIQKNFRADATLDSTQLVKLGVKRCAKELER